MIGHAFKTKRKLVDKIVRVYKKSGFEINYI